MVDVLESGTMDKRNSIYLSGSLLKGKDLKQGLGRLFRLKVILEESHFPCPSKLPLIKPTIIYLLRSLSSRWQSSDMILNWKLILSRGKKFYDRSFERRSINMHGEIEDRQSNNWLESQVLQVRYIRILSSLNQAARFFVEETLLLP